jgi:hypothetical protein
MNATRYEVQIWQGNAWRSMGERSSPMLAKRSANEYRKNGYKTRRLRVKREVMQEMEIR